LNCRETARLRNSFSGRILATAGTADAVRKFDKSVMDDVFDTATDFAGTGRSDDA
jgi:hypothetical protein